MKETKLGNKMNKLLVAILILSCQSAYADSIVIEGDLDGVHIENNGSRVIIDSNRVIIDKEDSDYDDDFEDDEDDDDREERNSISIKVMDLISIITH